MHALPTESKSVEWDVSKVIHKHNKKNCVANTFHSYFKDYILFTEYIKREYEDNTFLKFELKNTIKDLIAGQ